MKYATFDFRILQFFCFEIEDSKLPDIETASTMEGTLQKLTLAAQSDGTSNRLLQLDNTFAKLASPLTAPSMIMHNSDSGGASLPMTPSISAGGDVFSFFEELGSSMAGVITFLMVIKYVNE